MYPNVIYKLFRLHVLLNSIYFGCNRHNLRYSQKVPPKSLNKLLLSMPKTPNHTSALKQQRQKLKEKSKKYSSGIVNIKVLGSGAKGAPRSVYLFADQSRYLFNCGEGTQRLAHEHKMKLSKLEHIFITYNSWENIGGLPGVALTIQDVGVPEITLHGPSGTDEIFTATRRFIVLKDLEIKMMDMQNKSFEDNVMTVTYVPIFKNKSNCINEERMEKINYTEDIIKDEIDDSVDYYAHERKRRHSFRLEDSKRQCVSHPISKESDNLSMRSVAMCYVCRLQSRPGSLNLEKCVDKGVPPGPLLGRLKSGEDIKLENGTVVRSVDVRDPDCPGPIFLVVECPSLEFLDSFTSNNAFGQHQASADNPEDMAYVVVHFTSQAVMSDKRYQEWMEAFPAETYHLFVNDGNKCMGSVAVHRIQYKLHQLHPTIFPLLADSGIPLEDESSPVLEQNQIIEGRTLYAVNLRPTKTLDSESVLKLDVKSYINEALCIEGFPEALSSLQKQLKDYEGSIQQYPRIVFLGTGSCIPNKTRNTSGIVLEISETEVIILDCGEGTAGQLWRFYGPDRAQKILQNLRGVYVSHLHADHHLGLVGLLRNRRQAFSICNSTETIPPLILLAPRQLMTWLGFYHRHFEPLLNELQLVPNSSLELGNTDLDVDSHRQLMENFGLSDVNTVPVRHCPNAFGVALRHASGWKITYSGDTMPCSQLVELGHGSDLLIHEATMEDELIDEARLKMHSTTSEAIQMGKKMDAKFTLLTHFSQRYAKLPRFNSNFTSNVGIAFDNMQVRLGDLHTLPLMYPALKLMFAEDYEEIEQRAARRQMRIERAVQEKSSH